jgi:shikimate dehydrogenase
MQKSFGLIGYPLSHSFSKKYFSEKFARENISECAYELFPTKDISEISVLIASNKSLAGLNVTIPYKESVIPFLDAIDETAKEIGAVNCIKVQNGKTKGFNTDVYGFEQSLIPFLKPYHKKALVLGTGGASKAITYALKKLQIDFQLVSREAKSNYITYDAITPEIIAQHLLIINTTPLGMFPNVETSPPLPYSSLSKNHLLFDLVYNPAETKFVLEGKEKGATVVNGLKMLEFQAEKSWKIWTNNLIE